MTQQAELFREIDRIPQKYFGEVINFLGYLQHKAQQEASDNELEKILPTGNNEKIRFTREELDEMVKNSKAVQELSGILSGMGDVDLDEIRMERLAKHLK